MNVRGNFSDFFFETMLPALNSKIWQTFRQKPMMMPRLFSVEGSTRSIEQYSQITGIGLFKPVNEAGEVRMDHPVQGYDSLFKHSAFGLGVEFSQMLVEDDKWGIIRRMPVELAMSCNESIEIDAASVFNNGFSSTDAAGASTNGPDGVPLFSLLHPLAKAGGYQANCLSAAADLDVTSLELALTDWETMKNSSGKQIMLPTPRLLVAPANRWNAHEILKGTMRSDTANNTVNAFKFGEQGPVSDIMVWPKLTDPDAWFLTAPPEATGLLWFWRRKPYTKPAYDEKTETASTIMRYRKSQGWHDFYGVYGSAGA